MVDCVVDSSVATKWALHEADTATALQVLADVTARSGRVILVDIAHAEVLNAIWVALKRDRITQADAHVHVDQFENVLKVYTPFHSIAAASFDFALKYRIAVYDAAFVATVALHNCDGVTADAPLHKAIAADFPQIKLLRDW